MAFSLAIIIIVVLAADYLFRRLKLAGLVGMLLVVPMCGGCLGRKCWRCLPTSGRSS